MVCEKVSQISVPFKGYHQWQRGALIQDAFPDMSVPDREHLKTGTHPACWDAMFGDGDEDGEPEPDERDPAEDPKYWSD